MRLRNAFISLIGGNLLVTGANLFRDITLAAAFGAATESDVFFLAISIPVFVLTVGTNAFRSVVVPALSRARAVGEEQFHRVSARLVLVGSRATGVVALCLLAVAAAAYFIPLPGVPPQVSRLFALFFLAILPMYAGSALVELFQGPLQVTGRFLTPSLLRAGLPLGIIAGVLALPGASIFGASIGGAGGVLLAVPVAVYLLRRDRMFPATATVPLPDDVRSTAVAGYKAMVAATLITYANPLVDQWVAGLAGPGATSSLGYASRLITGVVALVSGAVSQTLLIHFSRLAGSGDRAGLTATYRLLVRVMPWVGSLATLGAWLTSRYFVTLLYQRGSFDAADAALVSDLVNRYALQFPVFWTGVAGGTLVWALSMNRILVRIGIVLFLSNVIADIVFVNLLGVRGIPLSTTVVLLISVVLVNRALYLSGRLEIRLSDWAAAAFPVGLLAMAGLLVHEFGMGLGTSLDLPGLAGAAAALLGFAALGGGMALREYRSYRRAVARPGAPPAPPRPSQIDGVI